MFTQTDILWAIIVPVLISGAIAIVGYQPWRRGIIQGLWVAPVAMAIAFILAFPGINGGKWASPLATPHEASADHGWHDRADRGPAFGDLATSAMDRDDPDLRLLRCRLRDDAEVQIQRRRWVEHRHRLNPDRAVGAGLNCICGSRWQAREESPWLAAWIIGITAACKALAMMLTGSLTYGKFGLILGFAAAGFLPGLIWNREILLRGLPATFSVILVPLLLGTTFFRNFRPCCWSFFSSRRSSSHRLTAAATGLWLAACRCPGNRRRIPLIVAVIIAGVKFSHDTANESGESGDTGYYNTH